MKATIELNKKLTAAEIIELTKGGRIFSAAFIKKDGELRKGLFRLGVKKGVKGKGFAFDPIAKGLVSVYDMQKQAFRFITAAQLLSLTAQGVRWIYKPETDQQRFNRVWNDGGDIDKKINYINSI
jgi:hypothetical protein